MVEAKYLVSPISSSATPAADLHQVRGDLLRVSTLILVHTLILRL